MVPDQFSGSVVGLIHPACANEGAVVVLRNADCSSGCELRNTGDSPATDNLFLPTIDELVKGRMDCIAAYEILREIVV